MILVEVLALREGLAEVARLPLPVKVAYRLAKVIEHVETEARRYEKLRQAIFEKRGTRDGDRVSIPREAMEAHVAELNELLMLESELAVEPCVSIDDLGDAKVSAAALAQIRPLIREPEK
jgi:hypothetical protein